MKYRFEARIEWSTLVENITLGDIDPQGLQRYWRK